MISEDEDKRELSIRMSFFLYISTDHHFRIFFFSQEFKQAIKDAIEKFDNLTISRYFFCLYEIIVYFSYSLSIRKFFL